MKHTTPATHTCRAPSQAVHLHVQHQSLRCLPSILQSQPAANSSSQPLPVYLQHATTPRTTTHSPSNPPHSSSFRQVDPRFSSLRGCSPGITPPPRSRRRPRLPARSPMLLDRRPAAPLLCVTCAASVRRLTTKSTRQHFRSSPIHATPITRSIATTDTSPTMAPTP